MKFWLDTEFNGYKGELISVALVGEGGKEFYEVLQCDDPVPWVAENVIPHLNKEPIDIQKMRVKLCDFLCFSGAQAVDIVADWPDDVKYFCDLLITGPGKRIMTPKLVFYVYEIPGAASSVPYNALADARANMYADLSGPK